MIANELSYYPTQPTEEELALARYAHEQATYAGTKERAHPQIGEDAITTLGTVALGAVTGGIAETYSPDVELRRDQFERSETQRELGDIAMRLSLSGQFIDSRATDFSPAIQPMDTHELSDKAYLLAAESSAFDTKRALELAGRNA